MEIIQIQNNKPDFVINLKYQEAVELGKEIFRLMDENRNGFCWHEYDILNDIDDKFRRLEDGKK
jgi:hypothetical protein